MSAGWVKNKAELAKANSLGPPQPEKPSEPPYEPPAPDRAEGKLSPLEWNFDHVPDDEVWPCLIWEYGRSAEWIHPVFPERASSGGESQAEIGRFYQSRPSIALGLLHKMLLRQWTWSNEHGIRQIKFFPNVPWRALPPLVRANMRRTAVGLEPLADLPRLQELLDANRKIEGNEQIEMVEILTALQSLAAPPDTAEEQSFANRPLQWLPGGDGCDDVTEGVILGEKFLNCMRNALRKAVAGQLSPHEAQSLLEKTASGEISLQMLRNNRELMDAGYYALALRINWRMKRKEILARFAEILDEACPAAFRDRRTHGRATVRGPGGLELYLFRGDKKSECQPATALSALGEWRKVRSAGGLSEAVALYHREVSGGRYDSKVSSSSRDKTDAQSFLEQLFPTS